MNTAEDQVEVDNLVYQSIMIKMPMTYEVAEVDDGDFNYVAK